jgi:hypothetical protein
MLNHFTVPRPCQKQRLAKMPIRMKNVPGGPAREGLLDLAVLAGLRLMLII